MNKSGLSRFNETVVFGLMILGTVLCLWLGVSHHTASQTAHVILLGTFSLLVLHKILRSIAKRQQRRNTAWVFPSASPAVLYDDDTLDAFIEMESMRANAELVTFMEQCDEEMYEMNEIQEMNEMDDFQDF